MIEPPHGGAGEGFLREPSPGRQLGLLWGGVAAALLLLAPFTPLFAGGLLACPFKSLTGIPCPGCGTTRAALALARLDVAGAFVHYPLPALAWTLFLAGGLWAGWRAWRERPLPEPRRLPTWGKVGIVAAVLANWIYSIATGV